MPGMQICAGRAQHGYWRGKGYPARTDSLALSLRSCPETKVIAAGAAQAIVGVAFALSDRRRSCHGAWSLRRKRPVKGLPPDFEKGGNLLPALALVYQLAGVGDLLRGHFRLPAEFHSPALRGLHPGAGPFADEAALQLGQYADHLPHGPACRRLGVDLLSEGTEFDAALLEVVKHGDQIAQAAAQAVKFPDDERVAVLQCLEATEQGRALGRGS